jgi:ParE toxin of type II toxin-antitoxin system, parDE
VIAPDFFLHPAALEETEAAARRYRERSPLAAKRFVDELNQVIDRILDAPIAGPAAPIGKIGCDLPVFIAIEIIQISANGGSPFFPSSKEKS